MKVGYSLGHCVYDILRGEVDPEDVLVIVSGTDLDPTKPKQWSSIWRAYTTINYWSRHYWRQYIDEEERVKELVTELYLAGKLHQPRQFGAPHVPTNHVWRDLK